MVAQSEHSSVGQVDHVFGQDRKRPGEQRTMFVIGLTAVTMIIEITAGVVYGSMALLADGLHMASHAAALGISAFAYIYARRRAFDRRFSFGTGKVNALGGFSGAVLLALFAFLMAAESVLRMCRPIEIAFDQAMLVALLGLLVNGFSVVILGEHHDEEDSAEHAHASNSQLCGHSRTHEHHHDHNLRAAYFHVLADAVTSVLAIVALAAGKFFGLIWMDPLMGIVGAALVTRWSYGLLRSTGSVLLDRQAPQPVREAVREHLERGGCDRLVDLHVWSIGPSIYAVEAVIVSTAPQSPAAYRHRLPQDMGFVHVIVEVHATCAECSSVSQSRDGSGSGPPTSTLPSPDEPR